MNNHQKLMRNWPFWHTIYDPASIFTIVASDSHLQECCCWIEMLGMSEWSLSAPALLNNILNIESCYNWFHPWLNSFPRLQSRRNSFLGPRFQETPNCKLFVLCVEYSDLGSFSRHAYQKMLCWTFYGIFWEKVDE